MLESQIREFQIILKNGGNLLEFMKKTAFKHEEEVVKKDDKIASALNGLDKHFLLHFLLSNDTELILERFNLILILIVAIIIKFQIIIYFLIIYSHV